MQPTRRGRASVEFEVAVGLLVARVAYKMALLLGLALKVAGTLQVGLVFPLALEVDMARFAGPAALKIGRVYLSDLIELIAGMTAFSAPAALKVGMVYLSDLTKAIAGMRALVELVVS